MESVLGRYRNLIILVGVLFLQVLGLAVQVKRNGTEARDTRLIRVWAVGVITPFERGVVWIENGAGNLWHNYFYLRGVRAENRQLKDQIEQMRLEQVRLSEDAAQARRLQTLLAFKEQYVSKTVAAQVIGSSGSDLSRVIYIDKGEDAGVRRDMAVVTADGIVGKVLTVYPSVAQVLLINDQSSGVGVILEKSRLQGVVRGAANGEVLLERVMSDEQVPVGEPVLTSGGDQIFPKGFPVGTVGKVATGKDLFLNIKVKPAANLSRLEEVLVLVEKQERQAVADDATRARASDILAQRLPTVPDKPAEPGTGSNAAAGPGTTPATKTPLNAGSTATIQKSQPKPDASGTTATNPGPPTKPASTPKITKASTADAGAAKPATPSIQPLNSEPGNSQPGNSQPVKIQPVKIQPVNDETKPPKTSSAPPNPPAADDGDPH